MLGNSSQLSSLSALGKEEWLTQQNQKFLILARSDLISLIFTCLLACAFFGFALYRPLDEKLRYTIGLSILAAIPLKNQLIATFHLKRPQRLSLLNFEDVAELRRCLFDETLYLSFFVSAY